MAEAFGRNEVWVWRKTWRKKKTRSSLRSYKHTFEIELFFSTTIAMITVHTTSLDQHVTFFTFCAKLTIAFTFTSIPLDFYSSVSGCGCGFEFEQNYLQIDAFSEKGHELADFHTPINPTSLSNAWTGDCNSGPRNNGLISTWTLNLVISLEWKSNVFIATLSSSKSKGN